MNREDTMSKFPPARSKSEYLWLSKGCSRRVFMRSAAAAAMASAVSGPLILTPAKAKAAEKLVLPSWGGTFEEARKKVYWDPFTKETGIEIVFAENPDMAKAEAMVKTSNIEWDLFEPEASLIKAAEIKGLLEPLDYSVIDATGLVYPSAKRDMAMAYMMFPHGVGWNASTHPKPDDHPKNFTEFWDPQKFPGRRGMYAFSPSFVLEIALLGDGVPASKVYPIDVDRAFASLTKMKPYIQRWIRETGDTVNLLQTNELDFTTTFSGRVKGAVDAGVPLAFSFDQVINSFAYMGILRGSKHKEAAMKAIAFMMDPARETAFCELLAYQPVKVASMSMLSDKTKKWLPAIDNPNNLVIDYDWWGEPGRLDQLTERFNEFKLT
jgi:putative spermidine/putrescine transport system substrate-binding protein